MDVTQVTTLIGSLGFPIVMSLLMLKLYNDTVNSFRTNIDANTKSVNELSQLVIQLANYIKQERK